jgi:hypothetical protein
VSSGAGASSAPVELDLTARPGEAGTTGDLIRPEEKPYDPAPEREKKRGIIALILVSALCGIIVLAFAYVFVAPAAGTSLEVLKTVLEIIFAPIVGLVGAVTGFYFGEKSR